MNSVNGSGMTICNQIQDPHVNRDPKAYRTVTTQTNGVWRVTLIESTTWGTFCQPIKISGNPSEYYAANPSIYYLRYRKAASASVKVYRGGVQCAAGADWLAWLVDGSATEVNPILELDGPPETTWIEPLEHGCFTTSDWEKLQAHCASGVLPTPWIAGESYPAIR
ncbi:hypothetical protein AALA26_01840 [Bifidobacterium pseudolongum]|jgi:hypothetical protein|uniref:hypothetical protein n=1 Tax=Bifidobacterium pseudolongum TaxID=1694 RepID=UPI0011C36BF0|nr:hypothetical protein [Bifidobacterium pseudolongum]MCH4856669.1 hypothetical protein [Bifidobacterium pseudolongum]